MANTVKMRAKLSGDVTVVKALFTHPMETGNRKDKTGKLVPEHFITEVDCRHKGESICTVNMGPGVSKNPYLSFEFTGGARGDDIQISWVDNKGESGSGTGKIK